MGSPHFSWLALLVLSSACVAPRDKFDAFVARERAIAAADAGTVGAIDAAAPDAAGPSFILQPAQLDGRYLLIVSTPLGRTKPTVLEVQAKGSAKGGALQLSMRERPLSAADRKTPVGPFGSWRTYPVSAEGVYTTPELSTITPAKANAVSPVESESLLVFKGQLGDALVADAPDAHVTFWCGTANGKLLRPINTSLDGSTFTIMRIEEPNDYPEAVIDCAMTPAEPL